MTTCLSPQCTMNGANHLAESDAAPLHLCPVDLRKLLFALADVPAAPSAQARYRRLLEFYERAGETSVWRRRGFADASPCATKRLCPRIDCGMGCTRGRSWVSSRVAESIRLRAARARAATAGADALPESGRSSSHNLPPHGTNASNPDVSHAKRSVVHLQSVLQWSLTDYRVASEVDGHDGA